jgi:hypothetical protein
MLSIHMLSAIQLFCIIMLNVVLLIIVVLTAIVKLIRLSVVMISASATYPEFHNQAPYAECCYAECNIY